MIIYRDAANEPEYLAYVAPSDYGRVLRWLRDNDYELGPDLVAQDREWFAQFDHWRRASPPFPSAWYLHPLVRMTHEGPDSRR